MNTVDIDTRHGPMRVFEDDVWISRSLRELGEHSQSEVKFMRFILGLISKGRYDSTVIDAGAYLGDLTIPLSRMSREVYAFEPHAETREVLTYNLRINGCHNVTVLPYALGDTGADVTYRNLWLENGLASPGSTQMADPSGDSTAQMVTLDSLGLRPDFIKADVEGFEIPLLAGAMDTLRENRCTLFLESDTVVQSNLPPLHEVLTMLGYDNYPMNFPMWNPDNWNKVAGNTFGSTVAHMVLSVPSNG